jgi:hypothetical protein
MTMNKNLKTNSECKLSGMMEQNPSKKTKLMSVKGADTKTFFKMIRTPLTFFLFFSILSCLFVIGCNKESKPNDVEQEKNVLIGKWGLIAQGYYNMDNTLIINPVENSWRFVEFFTNGTMKRPFSSMDEIVEFEYPYKIDGRFLYENYTDNANTFIYKYKVEGTELTLEYVQGNIEMIYPQMIMSFFQRIEE